MKLVRLIYVSIMTETCDTEALEQILKVSRRNNAEKDVTGILCYDPAMFLQCLEGPRNVVNELYTSIARDTRHKNVTLLEYAEVSERLFGNWSMAFVSMHTVDPATVTRFSQNGKFNAFMFSGAEAGNFLMEIAGQKQESLALQKTMHP